MRQFIGLAVLLLAGCSRTADPPPHPGLKGISPAFLKMKGPPGFRTNREYFDHVLREHDKDDEAVNKLLYGTPKN